MDTKKLMIDDLVYRKAHEEFHKKSTAYVVKINSLETEMATIEPRSEYLGEEEYKPMTLDEAIAHAKDVAKIQSHTCISEQRKCSAEHEQLAEWLQKLADYEDKTPITDDFFIRNGFKIQKVQNGIDKEPQPEYIYCNDAIEISAELRDEERGIWRVWINFLDECCPTDLDICTVGQLRMFLAIEGIENLVNEFKA